MGTLAVVGREDLDVDNGDKVILLAVAYKDEVYNISFDQDEPQYLTGDWVAKEAGREYTKDWGVADFDVNKDEYNSLADRLVEDGVIKEHDEAYKLVMDSAEPYLEGAHTQELESRMVENQAKHNEPEAAKPAPLTLADVRELISDEVAEDIRENGEFDRDRLVELQEASILEGVGSDLREIYFNIITDRIENQMKENIVEIKMDSGSEAEVAAAQERLEQFEKISSGQYRSLRDVYEDLDDLHEAFVEDAVKSDIANYQYSFSVDELAENNGITYFIDKNGRGPNYNEFVDILIKDTDVSDYAPETHDSFDSDYRGYDEAIRSVYEGIADQYHHNIDWKQVSDAMVETEMFDDHWGKDAATIQQEKATAVLVSDRNSTVDKVDNQLSSEEHTIQQAGIEGLKSTRSVADMTGTEPDSSVQDKLKEQIERSKFRSESNKETLSEIRGMSPEQFTELTAKMEEKYGKEGHSLTTKGVVEMACEDKLDGLKRNSLETVALRSADPEKYDRSRAERYVPAYVEPTKEAPVDPAVTKVKETGISL